MAEFTFDISPTDIKRVIRSMKSYDNKLRQRLLVAIENTVRDVQRHAVDNVPVKRGDLGRSVEPVWPTKQNMYGMVTAGGTEVSGHSSACRVWHEGSHDRATREERSALQGRR